MCVDLQLRSTTDPLHCHLDEKRLVGYWMACRTLTGSSDSSDSQLTPYCLINNLIKTHNYQVRNSSVSVCSAVPSCCAQEVEGYQEVEVTVILLYTV